MPPTSDPSASGLALRHAGPDDAPTLLRFVRALAEFEREPDAVEVDEPTLRAQLGAGAPPFRCLLAERGGRAVGFALYFFTYSTWRGRRGLYLEDLFVEPSERRNGVGRSLMAALARVAVAHDCARFEWSVLDWNEDAWKFYRSLGAEIREGWTLFRVCDEALAALGRSG